MSTFVLIHGAAGSAWYWHLLEPELRKHGHDVVSMDLPCGDDSAGLERYVEMVVEAVGDRKDLVVVAQSLAGFTGPLVCERLKVDLLVMLTAMVPLPGEKAGDWWANTGYDLEWNEETLQDAFFHDVPSPMKEEGMAWEGKQSGTPMGEPWPLKEWPDVPTKFLLCRDDRFFPPEFMRPVVEERLGITPDEIDGGHLIALSRPVELADRLHAYVEDSRS
jgi:pimeloyl-ACP methyl ester carboxylesterase